MKKIINSLLVSFVLTILNVNAATYYVRSYGDDTNSGLSQSEALSTVSAAIDKARTDGDIIDISGIVEFFGLTVSTKTIQRNITIQGDDKSTAIVQGLMNARIYPIKIGWNQETAIIAAPTVTIQNLTFKDFDSANPDGQITGGVISHVLGNLTCRNVIFSNNSAYYGGAISIINNVQNDEVANQALIQDCYFYNNRALKSTVAQWAFGGAVSVYSSTSAALNTFDVTIERCTFESNTAEGSGSAMRCRIDPSPAYNKILVRNCTFVNNLCKNGGLYTANLLGGQGAVIVEQSAVGDRNGEIKFINNTIAYNKTERDGQSHVAGFFTQYCPVLSLINNIFFSNENAFTPPNSVSFRTSTALVEARNNIVDYAVAGGSFNFNEIEGRISGNVEGVTKEALKLSQELEDNGGETTTLSLAEGSIAINAGYASSAPLIDQRGVIRVGIPDVGAYENANVSSVKQVKDKTVTYVEKQGNILFGNLDNYNMIRVYATNSQLLHESKISGSTYKLNLPTKGIILVSFTGLGGTESFKLNMNP